jgi:hypothetical protein
LTEQTVEDTTSGSVAEEEPEKTEPEPLTALTVVTVSLHPSQAHPFIALEVEAEREVERTALGVLAEAEITTKTERQTQAVAEGRSTPHLARHPQAGQVL